MICLSEIKHKYLKKTKILETSGYWRYLCFDIEDLIQSNGHTDTQPKLVSSSGFKLIQHWYFQSHARRAGSIPKNLSLYSAPIFLPHWFPHKCLFSLSYYPPASVTALWYYTLGHKNISASETSRSRVSSVILLVKILTHKCKFHCWSAFIFLPFLHIMLDILHWKKIQNGDTHKILCWTKGKLHEIHTVYATSHNFACLICTYHYTLIFRTAVSL